MSQNLKPLSEQTIVVTGASSGIGLATARRAAKAGANVVLAARNEEALGEIVREIEAEGGSAAHIAVDVSEEGFAEKVGQLAEQRFGGFDTWVNNAASAEYARLLETSMAEHRQVFDTGYFGLVEGSLYAARRLKDRGGALINVGSVLSERSVPIQGAYSSMKHAVAGFTEALRMELEMDDAPISVTLIKPHRIDTPYPEHARNKMDEPARVPPTVYDPRLVAKAICFAAEHPRRDLTVGGQGIMLMKGGNAMPRLMDKVMETFFGESGQSIDQPPRAGTSDNLYEARRDGSIDSNKDIYVRRTSLALEAQMHPVTTALIAGSAGALVGALALTSGKKRTAAKSLARRATGRTGAHQPDGRDSTESFEARIADENTIPEDAPIN